MPTGELRPRRRRLKAACGAALAAAALAACGGATPSSTPAGADARPTTTTGSTAVTPTSTVRQPAPDAAGTVWLCRPGQAADPCTSSLAATVVTAGGHRHPSDPTADPTSPFDCFYVYPTVSAESGENADLTVQAAEVETAQLQASHFSSVCRVWAPMYRQVTVAGLFDLAKTNVGIATAYGSLLAAWKDYLAHDNHGRPIVFIGHSQGSVMLIRLLEAQVDRDPALRARTIMAIIPGGNVVVATRPGGAGTFVHLPLCTHSGQVGCVVAYSTFPEAPPTESLFGRPGQGVSLQAGQAATTGVRVACTNPAALAGGTADLDAIFPTEQFPPTPTVTTPWVSYPDLYTASCRTAGGATWLQVDTLAADGRATVSETLGPDWGYHLYDVNLPLGDLVADVAAAERTWSAEH